MGTMPTTGNLIYAASVTLDVVSWALVALLVLMFVSAFLPMKAGSLGPGCSVEGR